MCYTYIDGDVDGDALVLLPLLRPVVPLRGRVVAHDKSVLGKLFVEALGGAAVDEEVQSLRRSHKGGQREEGPHLCVVVSLRGAGCSGDVL